VVKKIQVRVQGGVIREIQGIPADYTVQVLDYDLSRRDLPDLSTDENHRLCAISEWRAADHNGPAEKGQGSPHSDTLRNRKSL